LDLSYCKNITNVSMLGIDVKI